ncbi:CLUMA_CG008102, isoform A [Clunio marinus]|uniref:CLUMA_CG008102, isoform A n=1 Tax=Clunio marinus TaxID=568069 RepID=A0A1J1I4B9_9DIPT|nr:CLUMA_CG008102, isoform A [Clunio marinus]
METSAHKKIRLLTCPFPPLQQQKQICNKSNSRIINYNNFASVTVIKLIRLNVMLSVHLVFVSPQCIDNIKTS